MFAPIYECPNCGDVWRVEYVDHDCGEDDVITVVYCERCRSIVELKFSDGIPCWHTLSVEEMESERWPDQMWDEDED